MRERWYIPMMKSTESAGERRRAPSAFDQRLAARREELEGLYLGLYQDGGAAFEQFLEMLRGAWKARKRPLRDMDKRREADPDWYRRRDLLGMMLYVDAFAGTLNGVVEKLPYLRECGVNYLHLMPLLESPKGRGDGGYAVSSFRTVQPELGTMEDLEALADGCRRGGVKLCLDFVMNHTSEEHEWAKRARAGERRIRTATFSTRAGKSPTNLRRPSRRCFPRRPPETSPSFPTGKS